MPVAWIAKATALTQAIDQMGVTPVPGISFFFTGSPVKAAFP